MTVRSKDEPSDPGRERQLNELREIAFKGRDVDARTASGCRPLHWAIKHDSVEIVKLLLDAGADVDATNDYGETPLHWAASFGNCDIVSTLLSAGANVNATSISNGDTPLHMAAKRGRKDAFDLLIASGADASVRNFGLTAGELFDPQVGEAVHASRVLKSGSAVRKL